MPTLVFGKIKDLHSTETNVREIKHSDADIEQFVASILSVGLLQPPVVTLRPGRKKAYDVQAGEGRRRALALIAKRHPEWEDKDIPLLLIEDKSKVTEASFSENYVRKQMRLPEVYRSFALIKSERPSATLEEIGAPFGFDPARTARVMRLANLAPEVMAAYMADEIDDAAAQAYAATEDRALQIQVYEQMRGKHPYDRGPRAIKAALNVGNHELTRLLRYVGITAYRAAGGDFEADLFSDDENVGMVKNPAILNTLAERKVAEEKEQFARLLMRDGRTVEADAELSAINFSWVEEPPKIKEHGCVSTDHECRIYNIARGDLSEQDQQAYAEIEAQLAELVDENGLTDHPEEVDRLTALREELDDRKPIILPSNGHIVGVASVDANSEFKVSLWYANRAESGKSTPKGASSISSIKVEPSEAEKERARFGLSKDSMQVMMLMRRDMIRDELFATAQAGSTLAMDWLLFTQARSILAGTRGHLSNMHFPGHKFGVLDTSDDNDGNGKLHDLASARPERSKWLGIKDAMSAEPWAMAADPVEGFALFRVADTQTKNCAAALVAGHNLLATTSSYSDGRTPRMVRELANHIEQEPGFGRWRDDVDMNEGFFGMMSHKARLSLLELWGMGERAKGLKAKETAAFCARVVNCDEADATILGFHADDLGEARGWMPEFLETRPVEPLAVPTCANDDDGDQPFGDEEPSEGDDYSDFAIAAE